MSRHHQLYMPPTLVEPLPRELNRLPESPVKTSVERFNPLKCVRTTLDRLHLSQRWFAATLGISEQLVSAQLSDHNDDKHLSLRRLGRVEDVSFWKEFFLLGLEDLGFCVVLVTPEQKAALVSLQAASAHYTKVSA